MKFYKFVRSFFSKVNNITESLEKGLDKVVSRGEKNFSVHRKYMNFLRPRKTALDEPLYKLSAGRSMVEMLGVLAIIGVLSVGAISGYSKAMMKYRLNKQAEQLSWLLNIMYQYKSQWVFDEHFVSLVPYYTKMRLIPEDMLKDEVNDPNSLYDVFGMHIGIGTNDCVDKCSTIILSYNINSNNTFDICQNITSTIKNFHELIERTGVQKFTTDNPVQYSSTFYGDKYCEASNQTCLRNITLDEIASQCSYCAESERCNFYVTYKIDD